MIFIYCVKNCGNVILNTINLECIILLKKRMKKFYFLLSVIVCCILILSCSEDSADIISVDSPYENSTIGDEANELVVVTDNQTTDNYLFESLINYRKNLDLKELKRRLNIYDTEINTYRRIPVELTELDLIYFDQLLSELVNTEITYSQYQDNNLILKQELGNVYEDNVQKLNYFLSYITDVEAVKMAAEIDIEVDGTRVLENIRSIDNLRNPTPGSNESSDNYIDRCMEAYINENFTWANPVDRINTIIAGPAGLAWAFASCEYTYYFE